VEIVYSYSTAKMLRSLLRAAQQKVGFNNVQFTIYNLQFLSGLAQPQSKRLVLFLRLNQAR
jgi:hypothetical protein